MLTIHLTLTSLSSHSRRTPHSLGAARSLSLRDIDHRRLRVVICSSGEELQEIETMEQDVALLRCVPFLIPFLIPSPTRYLQYVYDGPLRLQYSVAMGVNAPECERTWV